MKIATLDFPVDLFIIQQASIKQTFGLIAERTDIKTSLRFRNKYLCISYIIYYLYKISRRAHILTYNYVKR